jgi:hypothetical protein
LVAALRPLAAIVSGFTAPFQSLLAGVGNNPDSLTAMGSANAGSWYAMPFRIEPDLGQITEYSPEPSSIISSKEIWDVFHDCVSGSNFANKTGKLAPESRSGGVGSFWGEPHTPCRTDILAREASGNDIDSSNSIPNKSV